MLPAHTCRTWLLANREKNSYLSCYSERYFDSIALNHTPIGGILLSLPNP